MKSKLHNLATVDDPARIVNPGYHPDVMREKVEKLLSAIGGDPKEGPFLTYQQVNAYLRLNTDVSRAWLDRADGAQRFGVLKLGGEYHVAENGDVYKWNGSRM